jgi:hypothetical protein
VIFGGCTATEGAITVIVNVTTEELPAASVAVHVTVVTPIGKTLPGAGRQVTLAGPELSVAVGTVYVTTEPLVLDALTVMFAGAVTVGACVSGGGAGAIAVAENVTA